MIIRDSAAPRWQHEGQSMSSGGDGSSDINQSGDFRTGSRDPSSLGTVTLGGDGGSYVALIAASLAGSGGFAFHFLLLFADHIPKLALLGTAALAGAGLMWLYARSGEKSPQHSRGRPQIQLAWEKEDG